MSDSTVTNPSITNPADPASDPAVRPVPRLNPVLLIFAIIPLLALGIALAIGSGHNAPDTALPPAIDYAPPLFVGLTAPDFTLKTADGGTVKLSDLRGQVVFLNFWATWCVPCKEEMPVFQKLISHQIPGKATVLAVDTDPVEDAATINAFEQSLNVHILSAMDTDSTVSNLYEVIRKPRTLVIDPQGTVRYDHLGALTEADLRAYIAELAPSGSGRVAVTPAPETF